MYRYREIYMTRRTVKTHAAEINRLSEGEHIEATITDHDAEDRATLEENGIDTTAAIKDVSPGIQKVQERLMKAGDGRPRIFYLRDSLVERDEALVEAGKPCCTEQEFDVYMWPKAIDGKPIKDAPVKMNDHGMDSTRYGAMYIDNPSGADWNTVADLGHVEEFKSRWQ
jgi:phage terminase large subunit